MHRYQRLQQIFQRHHLLRMLATGSSALALLGLFLLSGILGIGVTGAAAQSQCGGGDQHYSVVRGDTLSAIAARHHTTWQTLAAHNHLAHPQRIVPRQTICIPGHATTSKHTTVHKSNQPASVGIKGRGNFFPYGQCTWWANQRYHQLHGVYVPWTSQSNAWQWTARAHNFHWRVSSHPSVGAIIDLQSRVQGAGSLGHVAVVERVLSNGHVIASNMNWGAHPGSVVYVEFAPGPGVTFISR